MDNSYAHGSIEEPEIPFLYRLGEVAKILSLSRTSVYRQIKTGKLGSVRIGRSVRVSQAQLNEFIWQSSW